MQDEVLFGPEVDNDYVLNTDFNGQPVTFELTNFIKGAEETLVPTEDGENYLKVVESGGGTRHDHYLKEGEISNIHNIIFRARSPSTFLMVLMVVQMHSVKLCASISSEHYVQ